MIRLIRRLRTRTAAFAHDLLMVPVAWMGAYTLRFNLSYVPPDFMYEAVRLLPMVVLVSGVVFWQQGLYRGVWRFASLPDLVRIVRAVLISVLILAALIFLWTRMQGVPRSVLPLHALLLMVLLGGPRLLYRALKDRQLVSGDVTNVLIVGAGGAGEGLVRELRRDRRAGRVPVGFVDDDPLKRGMEIQGVRVLAKCAKLPRVVAERDVDLVILAMPSATAAQRRRIVALC